MQCLRLVDADFLQAALLAAGKGVRVLVFRLPPYVWGNGGSFFIPMHIQSARERGKAYYILPGESAVTNYTQPGLAPAPASLAPRFSSATLKDSF